MVVRAAQAGDAQAFASLYDAHAARLFAVCVGLTGDRAAAAELVQDAFVRAWEKLDTFRGDCAFGTWLHRVAVNCLLGEARARRRRLARVASEGDLDRSDDTGTGQGLGALEAAGGAGEDVGLRLDLERAIARLPDGARAVFVLYDMAGFTHAEIATHLGIAEGTSKAHLFRARRLLRGMLDR